MGKYAIAGVGALGVVTVGLVAAALWPQDQPTFPAEPRPTLTVSSEPTAEPVSTIESADLAIAMSRLDDSSTPWTMTVIGDSTGNDGDEWVATLARSIAADRGRPVSYHQWNPAAAAYAEPVTFGFGTASPVTIWNGSASGLGPDYSLENLPALAPEVSDVLIINHGHNFRTPQQGQKDEATLVAETAKQWQSAPAVAVTLQNPRVTEAAAQDANIAAVSGAFADSSYTVIDVSSAYRGEPDLTALLQDDGTHPNAAGQAIWSQVVTSTLGL